MNKKEVENYKISPFKTIPYLEGSLDLLPKSKHFIKIKNGQPIYFKGGRIIPWNGGYLCSSEDKNGNLHYFDRLGKIPNQVVKYHNYFENNPHPAIKSEVAV
jgi:hypothetical protein